jgi:hypothetical protein
MVSSKARTVAEYLAELPADRKKTVASVRKLIRKHLPRGFEEGMLYGMIGWYIPLERFAETYNGQPLAVAALAAQKGYFSLYLMGIYADAASRRAFEAEYRKSGKKLDMGKACLRFKSIDDLAQDVVAKAIARTSVNDLIARYEASRSKPKRRRQG